MVPGNNASREAGNNAGREAAQKRRYSAVEGPSSVKLVKHEDPKDSFQRSPSSSPSSDSQAPHTRNSSHPASGVHPQNQQASSSSPKMHPPSIITNNTVYMYNQHASSSGRANYPALSSNRANQYAQQGSVSGPWMHPGPPNNSGYPYHQQGTMPGPNMYPGTPNNGGPLYHQQGSGPVLNTGGLPYPQQESSYVLNTAPGVVYIHQPLNNGRPPYHQQGSASGPIVHPNHPIQSTSSYKQQDIVNDSVMQPSPLNNSVLPYNHQNNACAVGPSLACLSKKAGNPNWEFVTNDKQFIISIDGKILCGEIPYFRRFADSTGVIPLNDISLDLVKPLIQWAMYGRYDPIASNLNTETTVPEIARRYGLYQLAEQIERPELADYTITAIISELKKRDTFPGIGLARLAYFTQSSSPLRKLTCLVAHWVISNLEKQLVVTGSFDELITIHPDMTKDFISLLCKQANGKNAVPVNPYSLPMCYFHLHDKNKECPLITVE